MSAAPVLFTSHSRDISGAEFVLLDIVGDWPGAKAFLFEAGPLADRLTAQGLKVVVAKQGAGLNRFRRDRSLLGAVAHLGTFVGLIRELAAAARTAGLVYANSQKAFTLAAIAALMARRPLIWHLHDIMDAAHFGAVQRRMQTFLANRCASAVIVPSQAAAEAFRAAGGRPSLLHVVPNGRTVTPDPRDKAQLRADLALPAGPLIGVFSRLAPWKGQHVVLHALSQCPDIACVIVGDSLFGETAYADQLKQLVAELGLADRVLFLGQRSDVPAIMQAVDVVVHPSIEAEPFGLTLIEAMSVGVPVLASDAGASVEILDHGRFGTLVPAGDDGALAEAIRLSLADPAIGAAKAIAARERAQVLYTVKQMRASIAAVIAAHCPEAIPCR